MEAVIADMDGVLVDSEPLYDLHMAALLPKLGIDVEEVLKGRSFRGTNSHSLWTHLRSEYGLHEEVDVLVGRARESYITFLEALPEIPIVPGAREFIEQVALFGIRRALASSAGPRRVALFLGRVDLARYFEVVIHGDDVTHGKPHPEAFLLAAARLSVEPHECVVIEDAAAGVAAAKAAGMFCIGFAGLPHNMEDLSQADVVVTDFHKLTNHIRRGGRLRDTPVGL